MKGIINSITGLTIGVIACFFVFALQGLSDAAVSLGILGILSLFIKSLIMLPSVKEDNAIYSPSRSRRIKNRRLRVA